ncbi:hypothetical protein Tco_0711126 [Tanacetum coccineum]
MLRNQLSADCDNQCKNIILQGLPPEVYALERECKLYDEFDKFAYKKRETLRDFYLRFLLLLNDMNIYNMKLEQFQVNTKFLNTLPPEWSKFVTDVKLVQDLHTTNIDQLHAYLGQHEFHANEKGDDPIDAINHMMSFLTAVVTSRYPTTNNQLRNSSNPRQQATINDGKITLQPIQGRHTSFAAGTTRNYTPGASGSNSGKQRTVISQANGQILHEDKLAFLVDPRIAEGQATQTVINHNVSYQAGDLDVYDSDYDELNTAKLALIANLSHYETEITSNSNIIPYSQYVIELQQAAVQNSNSSAQQDALILSVIEQLKTQVVNCTKINLDNKSVHDTLTAELERYKEQVKVLKEGQNFDLKSNDNVSDSITILKNDFKKEESRNIDKEIALEKKIKQQDNIVFKRDQSTQTVHILTKPQFFYDHTTKQALGFQNPFYLKKAQQLEPKLYDGNVIKNMSAIVIPDSEETLMLAEESHSKMLLKQKDPMMLENKVNTKPVDYDNSVTSLDPTLSSRPTKVEVPKELPKVSMVNTSLKKLKHHLTGFDVVVKERTTATTITEGSWGLQEKVLVITALKDDLRKLKEKALVDNLLQTQLDTEDAY